jgi:endonuclease/exonuclease/phosphatase family metal-dependent hydrolase
LGTFIKSTMPQLKIVSFNVLAPIWADPSLYPTGSHLDRNFRLERTTAFMESQRSTTDVFCLQEIQDVEFLQVQSRFNDDFVAFMSHHDFTYWESYLTIYPWAPNGNAMLLKRSSFENIIFTDIPLSKSGNHCVYATGRHVSSNSNLRIWSIHLDTTSKNRELEFGSLLNTYKESTDLLHPTVDIIAGDFNADTDIGNLQQDIIKAGYTDTLAYLGVARRTHPFSSSYYKSNNWAVLSHILIRHATPLYGAVLDNNLEVVYPASNTHDITEDNRIRANLDYCGSDHYPITASLHF